MTGGLFYFCDRMKAQPHRLLLPTAYLPPAGWFCFLLRYDEVWLEHNETYPRQTYRNRCEIYTEKGKMSLSIPVSRVNGNHTLTKDVLINDREPWARNHWRAISTAYLNSPYFLYYRDELHDRFMERDENLVDFNNRLIELICKLLGLKKDISHTTHFIRHPEDTLDLREISPKRRWYEGEFQRYVQVFADRHGFIANLSILDLLFNLGPQTVRYLENLELKPVRVNP